MKSKNVLLYMTAFQGYKFNVINELEKDGWKVTWYLDNVVCNTFEQAIIKIYPKYKENKVDNYIAKTIEESKVNIEKIDLILIICGLSLRRNHIIELKKQFPETPIVYYAWDSVKGYPQITDLFEEADYAFTFDYLDAKNYGVGFLPLFYVPIIASHNDVEYDCSIVMTFVMSKALALKKCLAILPPKSRVMIYLKVGSWLSFQKMKLMNKNIIKDLEKYFHLNSLPRDEVMRIFEHSKAVIDCPLPSQNGLTMRTFEVLSVKKKLITTNKSIKNYEFYCPDNILIVDDNVNEIPDAFFTNPFNDEFALSEDYSLGGFLKTLTEAPNTVSSKMRKVHI